MRGDAEDQIARDVEGEVDRALGRTAPESGQRRESSALGRAYTVLGLVLCAQEQEALAVLRLMAPGERTDLRLALVTLLEQERQIEMSMEREESEDDGR